MARDRPRGFSEFDVDLQAFIERRLVQERMALNPGLELPPIDLNAYWQEISPEEQQSHILAWHQVRDEKSFAWGEFKQDAEAKAGLHIAAGDAEDALRGEFNTIYKNYRAQQLLALNKSKEQKSSATGQEIASAEISVSLSLKHAVDLELSALLRPHQTTINSVDLSEIKFEAQHGDWTTPTAGLIALSADSAIFTLDFNQPIPRLTSIWARPETITTNLTAFPNGNFIGLCEGSRYSRRIPDELKVWNVTTSAGFLFSYPTPVPLEAYPFEEYNFMTHIALSPGDDPFILTTRAEGGYGSILRYDESAKRLSLLAKIQDPADFYTFVGKHLVSFRMVARSIGLDAFQAPPATATGSLATLSFKRLYAERIDGLDEMKKPLILPFPDGEKFFMKFHTASSTEYRIFKIKDSKLESSLFPLPVATFPLSLPARPNPVMFPTGEIAFPLEQRNKAGELQTVHIGLYDPLLNDSLIFMAFGPDMTMTNLFVSPFGQLGVCSSSGSASLISLPPLPEYAPLLKKSLPAAMPATLTDIILDYVPPSTRTRTQNSAFFREIIFVPKDFPSIRGFLEQIRFLRDQQTVIIGNPTKPIGAQSGLELIALQKEARMIKRFLLCLEDQLQRSVDLSPKECIQLVAKQFPDLALGYTIDPKSEPYFYAWGKAKDSENLSELKNLITRVMSPASNKALTLSSCPKKPGQA